MSNLDIKVQDRKGNDLAKFKISASVNVEALMKTIIKNSEKLSKSLHDINRMRLTVGDAKGKALTDKRVILDKFFTKEEMSSEITLIFKDLGAQISWKLVFLIEYFGPILITCFLIAFQKQIYGSTKEYTFNQKIGLIMVIGHYIKRELETLFVHRFSNDTMPFFNVFKNSAHYWLLLGVGSMYFFLHPQYTPPSWASDEIHIGLLVFFCFVEFMNLMCHITLRNLRKPGSSERGIPQGWGFGLVSCANYFWESLAWLTYSISSQCIGSYVFWAVSTFQMLDWAIKKHKRYRKDFGDRYPRSRKAMFPFII